MQDVTRALCIHCEPLANIYTCTANVLRVDVNLKPSARHKTYWLSFVRALTHVPGDTKTNEYDKERYFSDKLITRMRCTCHRQVACPRRCHPLIPATCTRSECRQQGSHELPRIHLDAGGPIQTNTRLACRLEYRYS